ncbi:glycoside hydrolase family 113 [Haloimpatiens sp. FM7315]|uniref:glycoside hydrolase family 113 n=1 Tax=Haloimpatiens sp. FM7315 TaxID=3298609 RepID=UPI00370BDE91
MGGVKINNIRKIRTNVIIFLLVLSFFCFAFFIFKSGFTIQTLKDIFYTEKMNKNFLNSKIKSGNLSTDYKIDVVLNDVEKFGLNTINVPVIVDIKNLSSSDMKVNEESEEKAIELIKKLKSRKINIILEAYPWIKNGELYETKWKPNNINEFFLNWKNNALKVLIDDIAVPYKVEALNVASNFVNMEYAEGYWCDTIDFVRKYYKGFVTYRTCWWYTALWDDKTQENFTKKLSNKLYSKLDFISVGAYFELSDKDTNSTTELVSYISNVQKFKRSQNISKELYTLSRKWKKPIFFGELGFPKRNKAASEPWNPLPSKVVNNEEQARCFEAYRRVFENKKWFLGFSIFAIGEDSSDKTYYPSEKSVSIIKNWYNK